MKKPATLIRPAKSRSKSALTKNIFGNLDEDNKMGDISRENY